MQFDFSNPIETNTRRTTTIVPQQSLFLMNSPFTIGVVRRIMERKEVKAAVARSPQTGIEAVYRVVFQRTPTLLEREKAAKFLQIETTRQADIQKSQRSELEKARKRAEELLEKEKASSNVAARAAVLNAGELEERTPLTPWESLVQSLLYCNETAYLN
jgi:hypothetical protein